MPTPRLHKTSGEAMSPSLLFANLDEAELNAALAGKGVHGYPWSEHHHPMVRTSSDTFGLLCRQYDSDFSQPLVIIAHEANRRRLFGRLAQIRTDFSPLSTWCHVLTPKQFEPFHQLNREADLGGLEAAWTGLTVAEALLLSDMQISDIKIAACLATLSFAIARSAALWQTPIEDVVERYDTAHQLFRPQEHRTTRLRTALAPIWEVLEVGSDYALASPNSRVRPLAEAVISLHRARLDNIPDEELRFFLPLSMVVPEAANLFRLPQLTPEQRVKEFDNVILKLANTSNDHPIVRHALAMLAGYISTVAAGGTASLSLLQPHTHRWPEITGWAYVLGSLGQRVVWTSSFDGLGRLIIRELMRAFRLDEAPACDFALDEASVLFDAQLPDPFVYLRIKQARIATVSLMPGVNVPVPLREQSVDVRSIEDGIRDRQRHAIGKSANADLELLTDAVLRRLRGRIETLVDTTVRNSMRNIDKGRLPGKRSSQQSKLPLKGPDDK